MAEGFAAKPLLLLLISEIRIPWINQLTNTVANMAFFVKYPEERGDILCASCGSQRSDWVSTPGLEKASTRQYLKN